MIEQTREERKIIEPLNVLLVSEEFPESISEKAVRSFKGANSSFNSSRFHVDIERSFECASIKFNEHPEIRKYDVVLTDLSLGTWITGRPVIESNNYGLILAFEATRIGIPYIGVIFNTLDARVGSIVLESIVGKHFEHGKGRGIFMIQHEQQSSKILIAPAPMVLDTDRFPQRSHYAFFEELLKGTPHEHYTKRNEEKT